MAGVRAHALHYAVSDAPLLLDLFLVGLGGFTHSFTPVEKLFGEQDEQSEGRNDEANQRVLSLRCSF